MTGTKQPRSHAYARLRDFVLYIAISLAVAAAAIGVAQANVSHDAFIRCGGLIMNTSLLFGYFIADSRNLWRKWSFWVMTTALLSVHLIAFALVLTHVSEWKLIWFLLMYLEMPVLIYFRDRLSTRRSG